MVSYFDDLRRTLADTEIYLPGDSGYEKSLQIWSASCINPASFVGSNTARLRELKRKDKDLRDSPKKAVYTPHETYGDLMDERLDDPPDDGHRMTRN
ncbi:hypothetical protein N7520_009187 [Penicillium odoratum]|uniref:uncharacterized protein n=1 Tax=Penicillium odoratum TaxID=1167516 RepID=UPI002548304D|nr:uncharacterized protein N7520_009187 [Penicillium odoratum]KAJ5752270.1 hypothetical protein N7520_009187 [Penicillium odoratum]